MHCSISTDFHCMNCPSLVQWSQHALLLWRTNSKIFYYSLTHNLTLCRTYKQRMNKLQMFIHVCNSYNPYGPHVWLIACSLARSFVLLFISGNSSSYSKLDSAVNYVATDTTPWWCWLQPEKRLKLLLPNGIGLEQKKKQRSGKFLPIIAMWKVIAIDI